MFLRIRDGRCTVCTSTEGIGMAGPTAIKIELADDERAELKRWTRRRKTSQALATRARIVLAAAEGLNNAQICQRLGGSRPTVQTWRKRFAERRLEPLRCARHQDRRGDRRVPPQAPPPGVHPVHELGG